MSPSDGKMADPILVATIVRQVFEDGMRRQRLHLTGEIVAWLELEITSVWEVWEEEDRKNTILEAYLEMLRDELTTAHQLLDDIEDGDNAKLALELARKNCKLECRMTLDLITDGTGP